MTTTTRFIKDGEPVRGGVANRPLGDLQRQIDDLRTLLNSLSAGHLLVLTDVVLHSSCVVGQPVAWDPEGGYYRPALLTVTQSTGYLRLGELARVIGVLRSKSTPTRGDVTILGADQINLSASTGSETPDDGDYYLSPITAGQLTATRTSTAVRVLSVLDGRILIRPWSPDLIESHVHLKFDLVCKPAGTVVEPGVGDPHSISVPDTDAPGWLPADSPVFDGLAPAGAVFGYNLAKHPELLSVWPPLDLASVDLVWDKGLDPVYSGQSVAQGATGACIIDKHGLWWMSNCYQDVPWPFDYDGSPPPADDDLPECPRQVYMTLKLYFTRFRFSSDTSVVTELRSLDSRLKVLCADDTTKSATVGSLLLDLDLTLSTLDGDTRGGQALKELTEDGKFTRGWMVEGIYSGSDSVLLSSDGPLEYLVHGNPSSPRLHRGAVEITVIPESLIEMPAQFVRLQGAEDDIVQDIPFVSFPKDRASSIRVGFRVPAVASGSATMIVRLRLFGRVTGTLPALDGSYRRIEPSATPAAIPTSDSTMVIDTTETLTDTNQYVDVESEPFDVGAGEVVLIRLSRSASDAYAGSMGLIAINAMLVNS